MESIAAPVVTLFNISAVKVVVDVVMMTEVVCWIDIRSHFKINKFYIVLINKLVLIFL